MKPVVVVPNLNGGTDLLLAIESLFKQTLQPYIIIIDNASTDGSIEAATSSYSNIEVILHKTNKGYAGGVNPGFRRAIELGAIFVAPFNDDALADSRWLATLVEYLENHSGVGAVAPKVLSGDKKTLDSTGECLTNWGLPYPRGRNETDTQQYDKGSKAPFAVSGAASLYRVSALQEVGLLDEDYFAYYEDVDLGFRLQLAGWGVAYVPGSLVYHKIGMTSSRVKGFYARQTMKNLPMLALKNVPSPYLDSVRWRLNLALIFFFLRAITRGQGVSALKGYVTYLRLRSKKIEERKQIQSTKKVSDEYIWSIITHDLPPNATALRNLRAKWWKLTRRSSK